MKVVIVGLGTQGEKRKSNCKKRDLVAIVDKFKKKADFKTLYQIPKKSYDTVFICTPDSQKKKINKFLH